jgi:hypothetical protein
VTNNGSNDGFLVKFDSSGNTSWIKDIGGSSSDAFCSVAQTSDGGFIVTGNSSSTDISGVTNNGSIDGFFVKFDSSGNTSWIKDIGGSGSDIFYSVAQTSDGGYIAAGWSSSTNISGVTNNGGDDAFLVKFDSSGNTSWIKDIGGSGSDYFDSVAQNNAGYDGFLVKFDRVITITHPISTSFSLDPNNTTAFTSADMSIVNGSTFPVSVSLSALTNSSGFTEIQPTAFSNWSALTSSETAANIAIGLGIDTSNETGWLTVTNSMIQYGPISSAVKLGVLSASGTGYLYLSGDCGRAWSSDTTINASISLLFTPSE